MQNSSLYLIVDTSILKGRDILSFTEEVLKGGVDIIQLRDSNLPDRDLVRIGQLLRITSIRYNAKFIVNNRADIAFITKADGVHLGQDDIPIKSAREIIGPNKIVGISAGTLEEALMAEKNGADYVGLGSIFKTRTKSDAEIIGLDVIDKVAKDLAIPFFAIGGINENNLRDVIMHGAKGVAVSTAICDKSDTYKATIEFKEKIENLKKEYTYLRKKNDTITLRQE